MLDRSKSFTVFDSPNSMGARYQQGAKIFNSKDEELNWDGEVIEKQSRSVNNAAPRRDKEK